MNHFLLGVACLVVYAVVGSALAGFPTALSIYGAIGLLLPAASVVFVIVRRRREWAGCQRLFWDTVGIGMTLWCIGHLGWAFGDLVLGRPSWLQWHTLFSLCGGAAPLIALLARPHAGVRARVAPRIAIDIASCGLLLAFFYTYFIMIPGVLPDARSGAQLTLLVTAQALRLVMLLAVGAVAWSTRRSPWGPTFLTIAVGVGIGFFLRIDTSRAILSGNYQSGTIRDFAWIIPFLGYTRRRSRRLPRPSRTPMRPDACTSTRRLLPIAASAAPAMLIPVIGYGWLQFVSIGASGDSFRALVTSLLTVAGLGLLTLRLIAQGDELQRSDAKAKLLAAATEQTGDLILITREDGSFVHANDAFLRAMGYSRQEMVSLHFADLIQPGLERLSDHISSEVASRGVWRGTLLRRRRDGSMFPASCTVVALKDSAGAITHFVGVERDITEELKLRDQLVHTERLSAVGELVAGVAHEINNPLQTIVGCVELMLDDQKDPQTRRDLDVVRQEAAGRGRSCATCWRSSAGARPTACRSTSTRSSGSTVELRSTICSSATSSSTVRYDPAPLPVQVNREEIQQVILNLMLNAEQAIASAGSARKIAITTSGNGRYHTVQVSDDGPGISPELRGRIFEPFFSTKEVGEGTGLGLSISHGIATAHGGTLEVCESDDGGACFKLTLPAHADSTASSSTDYRSPRSADQLT